MRGDHTRIALPFAITIRALRQGTVPLARLSCWCEERLQRHVETLDDMTSPQHRPPLTQRIALWLLEAPKSEREPTETQIDRVQPAPRSSNAWPGSVRENPMRIWPVLRPSQTGKTRPLRIVPTIVFASGGSAVQGSHQRADESSECNDLKSSGSPKGAARRQDETQTSSSRTGRRETTAKNA